MLSVPTRYANCPQCVAMIRRIPAPASAQPATILRALGIFNAGNSEATNQTPAKRISRNPTSANIFVVSRVRASIAAKCYRVDAAA